MSRRDWPECGKIGPMNGRDQISGSVERITFYNEENGYTVLRLRPDRRGMLPFKYGSGNNGLITVVGNLPEVNPGEWLKLTGRWGNHSQYGRQFQVELCEQSLPATSEGIKRYLGSGLIRGVGKVMAERIVNKFGEGTLEVIEQEPQRLLEVPGIGRKRVDGVIRAWEEQRAIKDVMIFLQSHGVSTNLATKIYKKYGDASLAIVQNTPYRLVQDVYGIGFKTADKIAQALGLAADDPGRIEAGIAYTLNRMAEEGHVYMPQEELEPEASEILGIEQAKITAVIDRLETSDFIKRETITYEIGGTGSLTKERPRPDAQLRLREAPAPYEVGTGDASSKTDSPLVKEEKAVYLTPLYYSEVGLTKRIQRLIEHPTSRLAALKSAVSSQQLAVNSQQS
ncbi:MAG TPA: helix-hairpin-helix domain-containing protein, partial [Anaerolineae bacterium]